MGEFEQIMKVMFVHFEFESTEHFFLFQITGVYNVEEQVKESMIFRTSRVDVA